MFKVIGVLMLVFTSFSLEAQTEGRGNVPPGTSADGSRPADGAIKGGSIVPGERGGTPESSTAATPERRIAKCNELSGVLRDDCLRLEQDAGTGTSHPAQDPKEATPGSPPPQNPQ